jgi:hypothetical protein
MVSMRLHVPLAHGRLGVFTSGLLVALAAAGCGGRIGQLRSASAGQIGCRADEVVISDQQKGWGSRTWVATCDGEAYSCSAISTGESGQVNCTRLKSGSVAKGGEKAPRPGPSSVERRFDAQRKEAFVEGSFGLTEELPLRIVAGPRALNGGQLVFSLKGRTLDNALRACPQLSVVINAEPVAATASQVQSTVRLVDLQSAFDPAPFQALLKPFPEFTLRACELSWRFDEAQLKELQKLVTIHADLLQPEAPAAPDAGTEGAPAQPAQPAPG